MLDATLEQVDNSILSTATDISMMSTASKAKKAGRPKKAQTKAKSRTTRAKAVAESQQPSAIPEPEDDDFEVKVATPPVKSTRGKKRASEEMQADDVSYPNIPLAKRNTRTRSSTAKPESFVANIQEEDIHMANVEEPPPLPKSKKGGKGSRKRASSTTRKTSGRKASTRTLSTASKASLRAPLPADDEIDAQLEADLERFSSDGDDNWKVLGKDESSIMIPRVRPSSAGKATSSANVRSELESSILMDDVETHDTVDKATLEPEFSRPLPSPPAVKRSIRTAAGKDKKISSSMGSVRDLETSALAVDQGMDGETAETTLPTSRGSISPTAEMHDGEGKPVTDVNRQESSVVALNEQHDVSQMTLTTVADDSGHETDGSLLAQKKSKRDSKKLTKKGKQPKKPAPKIKKVAVTVEIPVAIDVQTDDVEIEEHLTESTSVVVKATSEKASVSKAKKNSIEGVPVGEYPQGQELNGDESTPVVEKSEPQTLVEVRIEQPQAPTPTRPHSPKRQAPSPTPTPQSSDAENHPPSARPSQTRPPLARYSPSNLRTMRVPLAASTPTGSPSRRNNTKLQTSFPWTAADLDSILLGTPNADKENFVFSDAKDALTSPEKEMSVEEWIKQNAIQGEEKLKKDCERIVGKFENEGVRALKALEGIVCSD